MLVRRARRVRADGPVDRRASPADGSAMVDDCPMTEECPGYDRDRRVCLLRPGDCDFSPADTEAELTVKPPEAVTPVASA